MNLAVEDNDGNEYSWENLTGLTGLNNRRDIHGIEGDNTAAMSLDYQDIMAGPDEQDFLDV